MKSIYTTYKERLIEISGKNRSIYSKSGNSKISCDLGDFFSSSESEFYSFIKNLWNNSDKSLPLFTEDTIKNLYFASGFEEKLKKDSKYIELCKKSESSAKRYLTEQRNAQINKIIDSKINSLTKLKKEIVDIARETGRYELYVGYPFVQGNIGKDTTINAPLILFPVKINLVDDKTVNVELIKDMPVTLNKALVLAYAKEKKVNIDDLNMEFYNGLNKTFKNIEEVISFLKKYHININSDVNKLSSFDYGNSNLNGDLHLVNHCVLGRYSLSNSIYLDYNELEKKKASTNKVIDELIYSKSYNDKKNKDVNSLYTIHDLDFTQEKAIEKINKEGNMVIYGPPGTGKSQTIVNVISDALARKKRVLIISQKKAALDVVYNRLGKIKNKAMMIVDPEREKESFYKRCQNAHKNIVSYDSSNDINVHNEYQEKIDKEYDELRKIFSVLYTPCEFGISLEKMYEQSSQISKNSYDYKIYEELVKRNDLLNIKYEELSKTLENINQNNRYALYYKYKDMKEKNAIIDHLKNDIDVYTVDNAINKVDKMLNDKNLGFDTTKYPYCHYLIAEYINCIDKKNIDIKSIVRYIAKQNHKNGAFSLSSFEKELEVEFNKALVEIENVVNECYFFKDILSQKGYIFAIGAVLNGNYSMLKNIKAGLSAYTNLRDIKVELSNLGEKEENILNFAMNFSDNQARYNQIIENFMPIRMYIEIVKEEQNKREDLAKIMSFNSIKSNILALKKKQEEVSSTIATYSFNNDYLKKFGSEKKNKDFLYQISKQQNAWPIRKFMSEYEDLMLDLYPCFLMSPETASQILPLEKDMFDLVLFDEASQVFIENTLPIMYRAKNVVVAGDSKQLRPSSTFMKRYTGADYDDEIDPTIDANLEVESLLDLATSRLQGTNLNYHYRSKYEELIDFSNNYFYDGNLEVVPNLAGSKKNNAIKRIKVDGRWVNRRNEVEANSVVQLLKTALYKRKNNESIGIIAFNSEQANAIEDEIQKECKRDSKFADAVLKEQNRFDGNEDVSLFVKNLENVQGDERDIIILSVGYAYNDTGRLLANFGSLSVEGGENRLNVAISRAKSKTFVVTSIEPEDLKVENSKNEGPKVLKKYLTYVRAVSDNKREQARICLNNKEESMDINITSKDVIAKEIKESLEELGYKVNVKIGNTNRKIDLAVYDKELDRYILGIDCINKDYKSFDQMIESKIYHVGFLQSRGWKIYPVWTRDWWLNKNKIINNIVKEIEKNKKELTSETIEKSVKRTKKTK